MFTHLNYELITRCYIKSVPALMKTRTKTPNCITARNIVHSEMITLLKENNSVDSNLLKLSVLQSRSGILSRNK